MTDIQATTTRFRLPVDVLGAPFHPYAFDEVVGLMRDAISTGHRLQIVPGNVDFVMKARRNSQFADALRAADLVVADGVPVVWASRWLGTPLPGRVSGTELVEACAAISADLQVGVALVGAGPGVAQRAAAKMAAQHQGALLHVIDTPHPLDADGVAAVLDDLARRNCHIVLAALGAPRQESFAGEALDRGDAKVAIGVGSAFDIISGDRPRAPQWMCDHGLEWAQRLRQEPARLGRRYLIEDSPFFFHLAVTVLRSRISRSARWR